MFSSQIYSLFYQKIHNLETVLSLLCSNFCSHLFNFLTQLPFFAYNPSQHRRQFWLQHCCLRGYAKPAETTRGFQCRGHNSFVCWSPDCFLSFRLRTYALTHTNIHTRDERKQGLALCTFHVFLCFTPSGRGLRGPHLRVW